MKENKLYKRVVNFGCSHAFGTEIVAPATSGGNFHYDNIKFNFGNLVSQHFDKEFKIAARPGNSNHQILHDVIEFVKPGDVCLLSWTYIMRRRMIMPDNSIPDNNCNYNSYHTLNVTSKITPNKLEDFFKNILTDKKIAVDNYEEKHTFIVNSDNPIVKSISYAHNEYYSNPAISILDFLEIYKSANEIIKQRGAIAINFHYDENQDVLDQLQSVDKLKTKYFQTAASYNDFNNDSLEYPNYLLSHPTNFENSKLYKYYSEDNTRLTWQLRPKKTVPITPPTGQTSFKKWYMDTYYNEPDGWPNGRLGHLDGHGHEVLSKFIINKLEKTINAH